METAGYSIAAVVLTILFRDGAPALLALLKGSAEQKRADAADKQEREAVTVEELRKMIVMLNSDILSDRKEIHQLRNDCNTYAIRASACEAHRAADLERIAALEDALTRAGVPFHKRPGDGSGPHRSLPPAEDSARE